VLKKLGLLDCFRFVNFSSDLGFKMPDSRIFLAGADRLSFRPEEVLYIGDSYENGIDPSRGLGMKAMHIEKAWRIFKVT
jgi:putative hydrolase of the HAD superfamily